MSKYSFRVVRTIKAGVDGKCYIAYAMDDFGNEFVIDSRKVNYFIEQGR